MAVLICSACLTTLFICVYSKFKAQIYCCKGHSQHSSSVQCSETDQQCFIHWCVLLLLLCACYNHAGSSTFDTCMDSLLTVQQCTTALTSAPTMSETTQETTTEKLNKSFGLSLLNEESQKSTSESVCVDSSYSICLKGSIANVVQTDQSHLVYELAPP